MKIFFTPENGVVIHDPNGALVYRASDDEYAAEASAPRPELPAGMVAMEYRADDGVVVYYDEKQNAFPVEGRTQRQDLDAVLAVAPRLEVAQQVREAHELALAIDAALDAQQSPAVLVQSIAAPEVL